VAKKSVAILAATIPGVAQAPCGAGTARNPLETSEGTNPMIGDAVNGRVQVRRRS